MAKKPNHEILPAVRGVTIDLDNKDSPSACLVGLLTEDGTKSFVLSRQGANTLMVALHTFLDRVDGGVSRTPTKRAH
ncbi:hypothetical protein [Mesorhizobium sp. 128a]